MFRHKCKCENLKESLRKSYFIRDFEARIFELESNFRKLTDGKCIVCFKNEPDKDVDWMRAKVCSKCKTEADDSCVKRDIVYSIPIVDWGDE